MLTIDTNVLVYAFDQRDRRKHEIAVQIVKRMHRGQLPVALQVCGEFYNVMTRKFGRAPRDAADLTRGLMTSFLLFNNSSATVAQALELAASGRFSYWDANLLTAAEAAGCTALLSEDMADGVRVGALEVVAPFGPDGLSERAQALIST
ncbi:PIN domain-containing protein [Prosthecomicrobium pneumaticum]